MVVINGVKYACERCIRGHRVSGCCHTNEPLRMIKRKGRPPAGARNKIGHQKASSASPYSRGDRNETSATDASKKSTTPETDPGSASNSSDSLPTNNITPHELSLLRRRSSVTIELPDGTILGTEESESSNPAGNKTDNRSTSSSPSSSHHGPPLLSMYNNEHNRIPLESVPVESLLAAERFKYQPSIYGQMTGPYNADLYNASTGNNAAAAAINASGGGDYAPNTGSVSLQPKLVLESELSVTPHELADSLSHIPRTYTKKQSSDSAETNTSGDSSGEVYTSDAHIPNLSNLY